MSPTFVPPPTADLVGAAMEPPPAETTFADISAVVARINEEVECIIRNGRDLAIAAFVLGICVGAIIVTAIVLWVPHG